MAIFFKGGCKVGLHIICNSSKFSNFNYQEDLSRNRLSAPQILLTQTLHFLPLRTNLHLYTMHKVTFSTVRLEWDKRTIQRIYSLYLNLHPLKQQIYMIGATCKHTATCAIPFLCRYKYTYMEEMLSNVAGARQVFERWMEWEPDEQAWHSYINMELRYKEIDGARSIYERYVMVHPEIKNWVKFAKFEERQSNTGTVYTIIV